MSLFDDFGQWLYINTGIGDPGGHDTATVQVDPAQTSLSQQDMQTAFASLLSGSAASGKDAAGSAPTPAQYITPDGHVITEGTPEDRYYKMADTIWTKVYGGHPPFSVINAMHAAGVQNTEQLTAALNGMPSHVPGFSIGEYEGANTSIQQVGQELLGRPMPDKLTEELLRAGMTTPSAVKLWFASHPISAIPKDDFHQIWDLANNWTSGEPWNTTPHPDQIVAIHAQVQQNAPAHHVPGAPADEGTGLALGSLRG